MCESRMALTKAQMQALHHVRECGISMRVRSREVVKGILERAGIPVVNVDEVLSGIRANAHITLNFHPDRVLPAGHTVVEGLLRNGKYYSQFLTGVSNGSRSAFPGGDRDRWERMLFGGAYHEPEVRQEERPKYGALNLMRYADGASPRYGSCFIRLRSPMLDRCTFTFGDSHASPEFMGTMDAFEPVLRALLASVEATGEALGSPNVDIASLVNRLLAPALGIREEASCPGRALDDYIEAQIHGDIDFNTDVEALVADPSYQGTPVGEKLEALCVSCAIPLLWHSGFQLSADLVPDDFRGPAIPPFAQRVADNFAGTSGLLNAAVLGKAAASLYHEPDRWQDWASPDEMFQHMKQLWHVLVKYGAPVKNGS